MAAGETFRNSNIQVGSALGELPFNVSLGADNTQLNPLLFPFMRIASDNTTAANRTFTLTNGAKDGQILHITLVPSGAVTTGRAQLAAGSNVTLSGGTWEPFVNDYITLQWDFLNTTWREVARQGSGSQIQSGIYTIALTAGTNVATATGGPAHFIRIGNEVTVSGTGTIASTAAALTASAFTGTLPIASNLAATTDLAGSGSLGAATGVAGAPVTIVGSVAGDVASFAYSATQTAAGTCTFVFTYTVI